MSDPDNSTAPPELTPEAKAVLTRARKSFAVSVGLLGIGLIAVLGAVVYRTSQSSAPAGGGDYVISELPVPQGAEVVSAVAADGKLTLTVRQGAMTSVRIYDGKTGALIAEVPVVSE
jgi:hypothetical protein